MKLKYPVNPEIDFDLLREVRGKRIKSGAHTDPTAGVCVMEAVNFVTKGVHSDRPACVHPFLIGVGINFNDRDQTTEVRTDKLLPLVVQLVGTSSSDEAEQNELYERFGRTAMLFAATEVERRCKKIAGAAPLPAIPDKDAPWATWEAWAVAVKPLVANMPDSSAALVATIQVAASHMLEGAGQPVLGMCSSIGPHLDYAKHYDFLVALLAAIGRTPETLSAQALDVVKAHLDANRKAYNRVAERYGWPLDMTTDDDVTEANAMELLADLIRAESPTSAVKLEPAKSEPKAEPVPVEAVPVAVTI